MLVNVLRTAPIEMWIELMNQRLVHHIGELADQKREAAREKENDKRKKSRNSRTFDHPPFTEKTVSENPEKCVKKVSLPQNHKNHETFNCADNIEERPTFLLPCLHLSDTTIHN
jgi:hypothetical protein